MPYVGNTPALNYTSFAVQHFTTSATTGYTLDHAVTNENDIRLVINNVVQQPGSGKAYTAAGTVLTLSAATTSSDTMYCVFLGKAVQTVNPPAGSVGASQLADDVISGQGALGAAPADTDEFLVSDAGVLKRVDYSYIKPTAQVFLPNALPIIVNGDMAVAQRAGSVTGKTTSGYYTVDRVRNEFNVGTYTFAQENVTSGAAYVAGFRNAFRLDTTTAATPTASQYLQFGLYFEGNQLSSFKFGGASATKMTIAFWVKSNKTGTGTMALRNNDASLKQATHAYTISVADTWEQKILVFDADTSAGFDDDKNQSLQMYWWLDGGSNFSSGATSNGAWAAQDNTDFYAGGTLDIAQSTSNDWAITGIQMLAGDYSASTLPPFQFESYGDNLLRCQRYYENSYRLGHYPGDSVVDGGSYSGFLYSTDFLVSFFPFKVNKRDNPTMTFYDRNGTAGKWYGGVYQVSEAIDNIVVSLNTTTGWMGTISSVAANTNEGHGYYVAEAEM